MVYRSRQLLFIAGFVCFGIGSSVLAPTIGTDWRLDADHTSKAVVSRLNGEAWLTASTAQPLAQSSSASSPSSASSSAPPSSLVKDWMWWIVLALIPVGVLAGVLYGLQRANRKTNASREERKKSVALEPDRLTAIVPHPTTHPSPDLASELAESGHQANNGNPEPSILSPTEASPLANTTRLAKVDIVEELIRDLHSHDPGKRRKAIWELGQRGDSRAVQPLVDLLVDSDSSQRSLILAAISEIGVRALKPMNRALMMSIQDDSADVRKNAIRDVTRIFDLVTQMSQLLQYAASDPDGDVQQTAEWALAQLNRIRSSPGTDGLPNLTQIRFQPPTDADVEARERTEDGEWGENRGT